MASSLVFFVAGGLVLPVAPRFARDEIGATGAAFGIAIGLYSLAALAARPFVGWVADRFGRRPLLVGGALLTAAATGLTLLVTTLLPFVAVRAMLGIGEAAFLVAMLVGRSRPRAGGPDRRGDQPRLARALAGRRDRAGDRRVAPGLARRRGLRTGLDRRGGAVGDRRGSSRSPSPRRGRSPSRRPTASHAAADRCSIRPGCSPGSSSCAPRGAWPGFIPFLPLHAANLGAAGAGPGARDLRRDHRRGPPVRRSAARPARRRAADGGRPGDHRGGAPAARRAARLPGPARGDGGVRRRDRARVPLDPLARDRARPGRGAGLRASARRASSSTSPSASRPSR